MKNLFLILFLFPLFSFGQYTFSPAPVGGEIILVSGPQYIYIGNKTGASQTLNLSLVLSGVEIKKNTCVNPLFNNRTCYIIVEVKNDSAPAGTSIVPLNNGATSLVNLKYVKTGASESSEFVPSSITVSDFSFQDVIIRNRTSTSKTYNPIIIGTDASKFEIMTNRCTAPVASNGTCRITFQLKPQVAGSYSAQMTDALISSPLNISANITNLTPGVIPPATASLTVSPSSLDFGTLTRYGMTSPLVITLTNTGNTTLSPIFEFSSKSGLILNRCSSILAGRSCSLSVGLNPDSSMPNGPILGQSVTIKKNSLDTGTVVSMTGILNVLATSCPSNQHLETGICVSNTRSCVIANGTGTQTWASNIWGSCAVASCDSGYFNNLNISCNSITYTPTYSSYSPSIPTLNSCDGTVVSSRTIVSCIRNDNFTFVATSNCSDPTPSISTQSPAGNKNVSITNGFETFSCLIGSSTQSFISRTCDSGYVDSGTSCVPDTYTPIYSSYSPLIPTSLVACDGSITSTRSMTCIRNADSAVVPNSNCNPDSLASVITQSPAGNKIVSITNGSETFSCPIGSSTQSFVSRSCDGGYSDNGSSCQVSSPTVMMIDGGYETNCLIKSNNLAYCWGRSNYGQIGYGVISSSTSPLAVNTSGVLAGKTIKSVSAGENTTCSIASDDNAYCWGSNASGALGNASAITDSPIPVAVNMSGALAGKTVKSISTGSFHSCLIASDDKTYCWGANYFEQLGINSPTSSFSSPVSVMMVGVLSGKTVKSVSAGRDFTCFVASDNLAYCWGRMNFGQLGIGSSSSSVNRSSPTAVYTNGSLLGKTIKSISAGLEHACAIASDDLAYCWGHNWAGQLGNGNTGTATAPVAVDMSGVLFGKTIKSISAGGHLTCAIASDDKAYCWGANTGNGTSANSSVPVAVNTSGVLAGKTIKEITTGTNNACVIASDDKAYCWGTNWTGQLGRGNTIDSNVPVLVNP